MALFRCMLALPRWFDWVYILQKEVVILGGAFHTNGNVNPAAEANILGDPDAADYVMEHGSNVKLVTLDVTHQVEFSSSHMDALRGKGKFGTFIADISKFYIDYYRYQHPASWHSPG